MAQPLKPCPNPKCGSEKLQVVVSGNEPIAQVMCIACRMEGPKMSTAAEAREAWDALPRVKPPVMPSTVEHEGYRYLDCPICEWELSADNNGRYPDYCGRCGVKLDWAEFRASKEVPK